ncbi:MAG TPA: hypothetical protein DIC53_02810 [Synergistaceae bacterium]|nr:hypothetical protein [Synergistaceae bacterium]
MVISFKVPESIAEEVASYLRKHLLIGDKFPPGSFIREADVAEELGVSRSPVREALKDLEDHGLIRLIPRKGAFVPQYSDQDVYEIYRVRAALEMLVYEHVVACRLLNAEHERWLRSRVDLLGELALSDDKDVEGVRIRFLELDSAFHFYIHTLSGLTWTTELLKKTYSHISQIRYRHIAGITLPYFVEQHLAIVDSLRRGDLDALRSLSEESARKGPAVYLGSRELS